MLLVAFFVIALSSPAVSDESRLFSGNFIWGCKVFWFGGEGFSHNTHPEDNFLPGANIPGSAGNTILGAGATTYMAIGGKFKLNLSKDFFIDLDVTPMIGGQLVKQKNANDNRPDSNAAFIYSNSSLGICGEISAYISFGDIDLGVGFQSIVIYEESGWYRWGKYQQERWDRLERMSIGPKIAFRVGYMSKIEFGAQIRDGQPVSMSTMIIFF